MKLLIDIGNSRIKWALMPVSSHILEQAPIPHSNGEKHADVEKYDFWNTVKEALEASGEQELTYIAVSCVKHSVWNHLKNLCPWDIPMIEAKSELKSGKLVNTYKDITQLGVDRWLAMLAATDAGEQSAIVIDAGTALTVDFVDAEGVFRGGVIIPGRYSMTQSVCRMVNAPVEAKYEDNNHVAIGQSTQDCVDYGVRGIFSTYLKALLHKGCEAFNIHNIVLTGGDGDWVYHLLNLMTESQRFQCQLQPILVLQGLESYANGKFAKKIN